MKVKIMLIICVLSFNCQSLKNREVSKVSTNEIGIKITESQRNIQSIADRETNKLLTVKDSSKNEFVEIEITFKNKTKNSLLLNIESAYAMQSKPSNSNEKPIIVPSSSISFNGVIQDFRAAYFSISNPDFLTMFELNENDEEIRTFYFLVEKGAPIESVVFPKMGDLKAVSRQ